MKYIMRTICILSCALIITACSKPDTIDHKGNPVRLSDYKGKWVIINYWATWCRPCIKEMAVLKKLYQKHKKKLIVLGVSFDLLTNDQITDVVRQYRIKYPMMSSFPIQKVGINSIDVLPISYIINPQGKLIKTLKGPQSSSQFLMAIKKKNR